MKITKIYKVVDQTYEEEDYPTLGVYPTLEDAKKSIVNFPKEKSITKNAVGLEIVAIYEKEIGFDGPGWEVFSLTREECYNEEKDEYYWKETEIIDN